MKVVTKYVATDGSEWNEKASCEMRDELDAQVRALESRLPAKPECGKRSRIDPAAVAKVKEYVVLLCRQLWPNESVFKHAPADIHPMSYAGRFLDDARGPISRIWYRFSCMNGEWEYDQPFYALNPEKFTE